MARRKWRCPSRSALLRTNTHEKWLSDAGEMALSTATADTKLLGDVFDRCRRVVRQGVKQGFLSGSPSESLRHDRFT